MCFVKDNVGIAEGGLIKVNEAVGGVTGGAGGGDGGGQLGNTTCV